MNTKLENYKIFNEVAKMQSFSLAAENLYISQSAVSQTIKQLESDLNIRLFTRIHKGVTLTSEGEILYNYTSSALNLIKNGENKILEFKELREGEIKIGAGDSISKYYLLKKLEKFHNLFPSINLKIINRTSSETIQLVKDGAVDIGFVNLPIDDKNLVVKDILSIQDIFIAGSKFRFLKDKVLTLDEIIKYPLIMLEKKSNSRNFVDAHFKKHNIVPEPEIELGSYDLLIEYAKINLGISCIVDKFTDAPFDENGLFEIKLKNPVERRNIGCCHLKNVPLTMAAEKFISML